MDMNDDEKEEKDIKRKDSNVKNLPQNISSTGQTIAPKILARKKKATKKEIK
jgi:hypothetical protein